MEKRKFKVTKTVSGQQSYRKWNEYSEGDTVIGQYVGLHICQYKKENLKIKVVDAQFKDGTGDDFVGKVLVINHCGSLEKSMEEVAEGEFVQIEYTGQITLTKGPYAGKPAHTVAVSVIEMEDEEVSGYDGL